jgi:hypothetical protein
MNEEKIPVFERQPRGETLLSECLGWVGDPAQAFELLQVASSVVQDVMDIPGIGKSVFGGVIKGQMRVTTDNGPYRDGKGLYRWQPCLYPFFDSLENAGKPTPLRHVYIYPR